MTSNVELFSAMNLLVTNTRNAQAYAIIRALRPYANKIVATMEGDKRLAARLSHAANSRLVDKRYLTPSPVRDWRAGKIQPENTRNEAAYIDAIKLICEQEQIDTIFPSFDPHVYVFAKNKEGFKAMGVLIPVPDYDVVLVPLDKYRTIRAAEAVGFPCPKTFLGESGSSLENIACEVGFPSVIKPRFSAGGRGVAVVRDRGELCTAIYRGWRMGKELMVQEYIPGQQRSSYHIVLDKNANAKLAFHTTTLRNFTREEFATVAKSLPPDESLAAAANLLRALGWWGGATVQVKVDARNRVPKLMEINPRPGIRLWQRTELGINEPLLAIDIAQNKESKAAAGYAQATTFVEPIEDFIAAGYKLLDLFLYRLRRIIREHPESGGKPPAGIAQLIDEYAETYFRGKTNIYNPYMRYFFSDPLVSILWWLQFLGIAWRYAGRLGKL